MAPSIVSFIHFFSRLLNVHRYPFALSPSPWLCPQTAPRLTSKIPAPPMMVTPGDKYTSGAKNLRFLTEIAVYLGNGAKLASVCNGSLEEVGRSIRRSMLVPMTLSDLERRDARGHIFLWQIFVITLVSKFDPKWPNLTR